MQNGRIRPSWTVLPATIGVLVLGRVMLVVCSIVSIRIATTLLGPNEMGRMHLALSAVNFFALLIGAVSLYFYRQVMEWHIDGRLRQNIVRYAKFLVAGAAIACVLMLLMYSVDDHPWKSIPAPWLVTVLGGNLVLVSLSGALLHCVNVLGQRVYYVLLANLASWSGLAAAVGVVLYAGANAMLWLTALLLGQILALAGAAIALRGSIRATTQLVQVGDQRSDDFRIRAVWQFSWPLVICTGLYWVQRSSYVPMMAAGADLALLGLFSVAFTVGLMVMSTFDTLFREYYAPIYYGAIAAASDARKIAAWEDLADAYFPILIVVLAFVAGSGGLLLELLVSFEFRHLGFVVAWGALGQAIISVYSVYMLLSASFMDNRVLLVPNFIGATVVLILLLALLPTEPMSGAALAVNCGLLATVLVAGWRLGSRYSLRLPLKRMAAGGVVAIPLMLLPVIAKSAPAQDVAPVLLALMLLCAGGTYVVAALYGLSRRWLLTSTRNA